MKPERKTVIAQLTGFFFFKQEESFRYVKTGPSWSEYNIAELRFTAGHTFLQGHLHSTGVFESPYSLTPNK